MKGKNSFMSKYMNLQLCFSLMLLNQWTLVVVFPVILFKLGQEVFVDVLEKNFTYFVNFTFPLILFKLGQEVFVDVLEKNFTYIVNFTFQ